MFQNLTQPRSINILYDRRILNSKPFYIHSCYVQSKAIVLYIMFS